MLLVTGMLLAASCTERIDIDLESTYTRLVVEGYVTTDSVQHQVQLSTTADYFSNAPTPRVSGALVEISFDDQRILLNESDSIPGLYQSERTFRGVPGTTYRLDISQVDINSDGEPEQHWAESEMQEGARLDAVFVTDVAAAGFRAQYVTMNGAHRQFESDWLAFRIWRNGELLTDTLTELMTFDDALFDDGGFSNFPVTVLNADDPSEALSPGDTLTLQMEHLTQHHYLFINDIMLESVGTIPLFTGPAANVRTNISGDARGIFAAYEIHRSSTIYSGK